MHDRPEQLRDVVMWVFILVGAFWALIVSVILSSR